MKRKWAIIGVAIAAVAIGLIVYNLISTNPEGPVIPPDVSNREERYLDSPVGGTFSVDAKVVMDKCIAPAVFEFENVIPGAVIDTWTDDSYVLVGEDWVSYTVGQDMWMLVYNGLDSTVTYSLKLVNAPEELNECKFTGKWYSKAPEGALGGVTFPKTITVGPMSAIKVPISINYPEGIDYPDQWEFRISVFDLRVLGMVETGLEFRFFSYMR